MSCWDSDKSSFHLGGGAVHPARMVHTKNNMVAGWFGGVEGCEPEMPLLDQGVIGGMQTCSSKGSGSTGK